MPNIAGVAGSPAWISADIACAASGTIAPASSAAPCRAGRHRAASTATATTATHDGDVARDHQAPGCANALPAVTVCEVPVEAWVSV